jgi:hypothetical protein
VPEAGVPARPSWRRRIVARIKRAHWLFRLSDFVLVRLQRQDDADRKLDRLQTALNQILANERVLGTVLREHDIRLQHHETGPLLASRRLLNKRRKPLRAQNGQNGKPAPIAPTEQAPT